MATYALFCGDMRVCEVSHNTEIPQAITQQEKKCILEKATNTTEYKTYCERVNSWVGFGYLEIKLNV